jgi:peroxiredoxin
VLTGTEAAGRPHRKGSRREWEDGDVSNPVADPDQQLVGRPVPSIKFCATTGGLVDLADPALGDYVLFIYPRTGRPDQPDTDDWALIPGAKGCTAESCQFRDLNADFARIGLSIYGLSTQDTVFQQEAAQRLHLPYPLLSDPQAKLGHALGLARFVYNGQELYRRSTLAVRDGKVVMAELEITDPASHPRDFLDALSSTTRG